jgi:hypothetical protein
VRSDSYNLNAVGIAVVLFQPRKKHGPSCQESFHSNMKQWPPQWSVSANCQLEQSCHLFSGDFDPVLRKCQDFEVFEVACTRFDCFLPVLTELSGSLIVAFLAHCPKVLQQISHSAVLCVY